MVKYHAIVNSKGYIVDVFTSKEEAIKQNGGEYYEAPENNDYPDEYYTYPTKVVSGIENILNASSGYTKADIIRYATEGR